VPPAIGPAGEVGGVELQHAVACERAARERQAKSRVAEEHFGRQEAVAHQALGTEEVDQYEVDEFCSLAEGGGDAGPFVRANH
jgi:hypothetical protein